ncbi:hypothetical protein Asi02nite_36440 [Asanoa siamensis]|uniref:CopG family transcriptional regulator n=2 Tax=Asanoa siamensis TaxID=926357 RepID=A0ABQ4CS57_9ACTN|nr:hypothetical protein Asi02nite_36440 [Asanoa siamensis]
MDGYRVPAWVPTPITAGGLEMTDSKAARRTIEVEGDVYDVLERTASARDTDINGALRYLIEAPTPRALVADEDED